MKNFLKIIIILAVIGIVAISLFFVLDLITANEVKDTLQKTLLILGIIALGGLVVSLISHPKK